MGAVAMGAPRGRLEADCECLSPRAALVYLQAGGCCKALILLNFASDDSREALVPCFSSLSRSLDV